MTNNLRRAAVAAILALPATLAAQTPTTPAITPADLRTRLYIFADDSMLGREAGTVNNLRGTAYIEREVRRLGLVPAGDSGGYFQNVPLTRRGLVNDAAINVDDAKFVAGRDFLVRDNGVGQRAIDGAQAVFGGTWGDTNSFIAPAAATGKVVVIRMPRGWQANRELLTRRFTSAAAIAVATYDAMPQEVRDYLSQSSIELGNDNAAEPASTSDSAIPSFFYVSRALASAMLGTALDGASRATAVGRTVHGNIAEIDQRLPGRNVVAILRGSDPALAGQYVALGAHNDHVGFDHSPVDHDSLRAVLTVARPMGADSPERPLTAAERRRVRVLTDSLHRAHNGARADSIYNGADDDGSGSMALLEIAEQLASAPVKPRRSILFVWHTGEELGMFGSTWYTDHPTVPRDSIVAQLNVDMIGRGTVNDVPNGGAHYLQLIGSRRLSTELGNIVEQVNRETKAGFVFDYQFDANGHPEQYYCRSDHYEYARWGIPITFFSTGSHRDYHQVTDEPQYIDYPKYARVTSFVRDVALKVANLDHRVVVNKPKPDPHGECVQ